MGILDEAIRKIETRSQIFPSTANRLPSPLLDKTLARRNAEAGERFRRGTPT